MMSPIDRSLKCLPSRCFFIAWQSDFQMAQVTRINSSFLALESRRLFLSSRLLRIDAFKPIFLSLICSLARYPG